MAAGAERGHQHVKMPELALLLAFLLPQAVPFSKKDPQSDGIETAHPHNSEQKYGYSRQGEDGKGQYKMNRCLFIMSAVLWA
jgi:hypothetical protein